jgi:hypothetical protein
MLYKALLPSPEIFYREQFDRVGKPNRDRWASVLCCFHPDRNPSLRVNLHSGAFKCWSCGAAGGDVIAFLMQRDGLSFPDACRQLGAWEEPNSKTVTLPSRVVVGRDLVMKFRIAGTGYTARVNDDPGNFLELMRRVYAQAGDRLAELHHGDQEQFPGETDVQWGLLADSWELIWVEVGRG